MSGTRARLTVACAVLASGGLLLAQETTTRDEGAFRFRTGVQLINVTTTVTDRNGRFVTGLTKDDFRLLEDGEPQPITHFSNERVPVSLGIVLDASGSMAGEKLASAREAIDRFLYELLDPADEIFIYGFNDQPELVQDWTTDRQRLSRAMGRIVAHGGTAMYDAVAEAVPLAESGRHRKKALVVISDGNDTSSHVDVPELKQLIRQTEVLVYAIGIDGRSQPTFTTRPPTRLPIPLPFPIPGRRSPWPAPPQRRPGGSVGVSRDERVNAGALRELTNDTGGRTELIRSAHDLDPATAGIADELSRQYYLGYPAPGKNDGRWHAIEVEVSDPSYHVRARRGYVAS